jgi:hypothetical protein
MKSFKEFMINENNDPPMILVLKRVGIRNFAGGQRVALYRNDAMKVEFSIPYNNVGKLEGPPGISSLKEGAENEIIEEHEHKFSYLGGEAKCDCGKYIQPDGRITDGPNGSVDESAMHHINRIINSGKEDLITFRNGGSARVHPVTAKMVLDLHKKVNAQNQAKLVQMINSSPRGLEKVAKFAMSHIKK